ELAALAGPIEERLEAIKAAQQALNERLLQFERQARNVIPSVQRELDAAVSASIRSLAVHIPEFEDNVRGIGETIHREFMSRIETARQRAREQIDPVEKQLESRLTQRIADFEHAAGASIAAAGEKLDQHAAALEEKVAALAARADSD